MPMRAIRRGPNLGINNRFAWGQHISYGLNARRFAPGTLHNPTPRRRLARRMAWRYGIRLAINANRLQRGINTIRNRLLPRTFRGTMQRQIGRYWNRLSRRFTQR